MLNRIWDPEGKYEGALLKEFKHWAIEVSFRQHTLGCFIIFARRKVERISDLTTEEASELSHVMKEIETALSSSSTFDPDRFNYLQMGNTLHHLHFHGIPRYKKERSFDGKMWKDETYGHPPIWVKDEVSAELVIKLKDSIKKSLIGGE